MGVEKDCYAEEDLVYVMLCYMTLRRSNKEAVGVLPLHDWKDNTTTKVG